MPRTPHPRSRDASRERPSSFHDSRDRDRDRDRDWDRDWDRDRDSEWGRDRDRGNRGTDFRDHVRDSWDRDRDRGQGGRREGSPHRGAPPVRRLAGVASPVPKGPKLSTQKSPGVASPVPKGPKLSTQKSPGVASPVPKGPKSSTPTSARPAHFSTGTASTASSSSSLPEKADMKARDMAATALDRAIRKSREAFDLQKGKTALIAAEKRRSALQKHYPDFPSVADFNARMEKPRAARQEAVEEADQRTYDSLSSSKNFVSQILVMIKKEIAANGANDTNDLRSTASATPMPHDKSMFERELREIRADILKSEAKLEAKIAIKIEARMEAKLMAKFESMLNTKLAAATIANPANTAPTTATDGTKTNTAEVPSDAAKAALQVYDADIQRLKEENERLTDKLSKVTELAEQLMADTKSAQDTHRRLDAEVGRLSSRAIKHTEQLQNVENKLDTYDSTWSDVKPENVRSMVEFVATEKPKLEQDIQEQKAATDDLKNDIQTLRLSAASSTPAALPVLPTTAPSVFEILSSTLAASPSQSRGAAIAFPGDDFESLRNEIGILNERLNQVETLSSTANMLSGHHTTLITQLQDSVKRSFDGQKTLAEVFDNMLTAESTGRKADGTRLEALEKLVETIQKEGDKRDPLRNVLKAVENGSTGTAMANANATAGSPRLSAPESESDIAAQADNQLITMASAASEAPDASSTALAVTDAAAITTNIASSIVSGTLGASAVQNLAQEIGLLQAKTEATDVKVMLNKEDADGQCSALRLMIETLDNRFNNLTTRDMCNAIVGHIEKMVPNARQFDQDLKRVLERIGQIEASLVGVTSNGNGNGQTRSLSGKRVSEVEDASNTTAGAQLKRRRTDGAAWAPATASTMPSTSAAAVAASVRNGRIASQGPVQSPGQPQNQGQGQGRP